jgi:hypothetical protein
MEARIVRVDERRPAYHAAASLRSAGVTVPGVIATGEVVTGEDASGEHASVAAAPGDDAVLVALERQFSTVAAELLGVLRIHEAGRGTASPANSGATRARQQAEDEAMTERIEAILWRLEPIERAIMEAPARTLVGLGVKARHAAHVVSQYWEQPIDQADWESRAVRLLIEAVCKVAGAPLPAAGLGDGSRPEAPTVL